MHGISKKKLQAIHFLVTVVVPIVAISFYSQYGTIAPSSPFWKIVHPNVILSIFIIYAMPVFLAICAKLYFQQDNIQTIYQHIIVFLIFSCITFYQFGIEHLFDGIAFQGALYLIGTQIPFLGVATFATIIRPFYHPEAPEHKGMGHRNMSIFFLVMMSPLFLMIWYLLSQSYGIQVVLFGESWTQISLYYGSLLFLVISYIDDAMIHLREVYA